jgi:hypothetical protein
MLIVRERAKRGQRIVAVDRQHGDRTSAELA